MTTGIPFQTDEQLLEAQGQGKAGAMDMLLARYLDKVCQFAAWKTGMHGTELEDITQEIFLQVIRSAGSFNGRSRFRTWLYGVANHVCCRWVRGTTRRRRVEVEWGGNADEERSFELVDGRPDPLDRLQRRERARTVRAAVDDLSPDHKEVLILVDWEEMSYAEIGEALDVPVGTVKSRVHHARLQLAGALAELNRG